MRRTSAALRAPHLVRSCALLALVLGGAARAEPVTYTGFTITDGQLGGWKFHNARIYLTFRSDTTNVAFMQFPDGFGGFADTYVNQVGSAAVTIVEGTRTVRARLAPNQILIASDLGDSSFLPHIGGRGIGFSSLTATGLEASYPLGVEDGTIDWGDISDPGIAGPALATLSTDLQHSTAFSGRAWACVAFPNDCVAPNALQTDRGALTLETPFAYAPAPSISSGADSLSAGFFVVDVGGARRGPPRLPIAREKGRIAYHAYTVSNVTLGHHHFSAAQVYLSFEGATSKVQPFNNGPSSHGYYNAEGRARVTIVSGKQVVSAEFEPGEIYVYYDVGASAVGFGSRKGGPGYPLALTANLDFNDLVGGTTVGAVADLTREPLDAALYTTATAGLATDLTNATALSGAANSCASLEFLTSACANLTPVPLRTSAGHFLLEEPYTEDERANQVAGPYSINWGVFWSQPGEGRDCDDRDRDDDDDGSDD
ncbi:MAG TPA: hypothetical protein VMT11_16700 [Myxococcaceae bacterium]|nr:hypothetical protein [Myxococcaceae bacterium]